MDCNLMPHFEMVPTKRLKPNRYNPNRMTDGQVAALERAIAMEGFCGVVLVNKTPKGLTIVDGEHRWRAAKKVGLKEVPCLIGDFSEEQAKALTIKLNQIHGNWQAAELVSLLESLDEPLADLGFSEQEFVAELEMAIDDVSKRPVANVSGTQRKQTRAYVGFMLTPGQQRLLAKALDAAALSCKDPSMTRSEALGEVLRSYVNQHQN